MPEGISPHLVIAILTMAMMSLQYAVTSEVVAVVVASSESISLSSCEIYRWLAQERTVGLVLLDKRGEHLVENDIRRFRGLPFDNLSGVEGSGCSNCFLYLALRSCGGHQKPTNCPYEEHEETDKGDE